MKIRNVALQAKVKSARHSGVHAALKVVLLSDFHRGVSCSARRHGPLWVSYSVTLCPASELQCHAALQWRLLTEFTRSELVHGPHKIIPYFTDGKIGL